MSQIAKLRLPVLKTDFVVEGDDPVWSVPDIEKFFRNHLKAKPDEEFEVFDLYDLEGQAWARLSFWADLSELMSARLGYPQSYHVEFTVDVPVKELIITTRV